VSPTRATRERPTLEEARTRLRELGYLDGRVERFLFRRAFEGRGGYLLPAVLFGAFGAALSAVAAVEAAEPGFGSSVTAVLVLFVHLAVAFVLPAALLAVLLAVGASRSHRPAAHATLAGLAAAGLVFFLWVGGSFALSRDLEARSLLWGAPVSIAALLLARSVRSGFLAAAYAHSGALPERPRRRVFFGAAVLALLVAAAIFAARPETPPVPAPRPAPRQGRVVVFAADGFSLEEASGADASARLLARGGTGWWPAQNGSPPEIWTNLSTGVEAARHGVRALVRVRPSGSPLALRPPLGTAWYLRFLAPAAGLAASAPVSAADREAPAFWEVAASAGLPALAVGWWASGPWPGATVIGNQEILAEAKDGLEADRIALERFERERAGGCSVCAVYLPGCDIVRADAALRARARARLAGALESEVARSLRGEQILVVLVADSHPAAGALGRMIVFDRGGTPRTVRIRAEDVAPSILARAGVPVASDLPGHPVASLFAEGSLESATVPTYGARVAPAAPASPASDREYLEKLRSLGYLN
jgi:hypothetical protein